MANAQATRTWVSGVGDDVNPCSRTAPCKTFAGAISKTAAGGEISVLDPGGFGTINITKSMTLNGDGTLGGILAAGVTGVIVNAGLNDVVYLRNLSINGANTGTNGIRYLAGKALHVESCNIYGFNGAGFGFGIDMSHTTSGNGLFVRDTNIKNVGNTGIRVTTTSGFVVAVMERVSIDGLTNAAGSGINFGANAFGSVRDSVISLNTNIAINITGGNSAVNIENCLLNHNGTAVSVASGATVRLSQNSIHANSTGIAGTGTVRSSGNNRIYDNISDGVTPAIITPK
jgi:hypothetical protein